MVTIRADNQLEIRRRRNANKLIIKTILFSLSVDVPFQRYIFGKSTSLFVARMRLFVMTELLLKFALAYALSDCAYARWRYAIYDWTIYFPVNRRSGVHCSYIGMIFFQCFLKISVIFHGRGRFDPSLVDYLCKEPPPPPVAEQVHETVAPNDRFFRSARESTGSGHLCSEATTSQPCQADRNYLRNRSHWIRLSTRLSHSFRVNLALVVPLCLWIISKANMRISSKVNERACDLEPPFLRLVGLVEVNYMLIECTFVIIGVHCYCLLVKDDICLQLRSVIKFADDLLIAARKLGGGRALRPTANSVGGGKASLWTTNMTLLTDPFNHFSSDKSSKCVDQKHKLRKSVSRLQDQRAHLLSGSEGALCKRQNLSLNYCRNRAGDGHFSTWRIGAKDVTDSPCARHEDLYASEWPNSTFMPNFNLLGSTAYPSSRAMHDHHYNGSDYTGDSTNDNNCIFTDTGDNLYDNEAKRARATMMYSVVQAQDRVILALRCLESHKAPINFIGNAFLIWLMASLCFVPLFVNSRRLSAEERGADKAYIAACCMSIITGVMFSASFAVTYDRTIELARLIFGLSAAYHSRAVAARWNKILLIWFCPNRTAFKVAGLFKLTSLNILKSFSFLVSGLTLVMTYFVD